MYKEFKGTKEKLSISESNSQNINAEGKGLIATTFYGKGIFNKDTSKEESVANAKLFCVAPMMLKYLSDRMEYLESINFTEDSNEFKEWVDINNLFYEVLN